VESLEHSSTGNSARSIPALFELCSAAAIREDSLPGPAAAPRSRSSHDELHFNTKIEPIGAFGEELQPGISRELEHNFNK